MTRVQANVPPPGERGPRTGMYVALLVFLLGVLAILLFLLARSMGVLSTSTPDKVDVPNVVGLKFEEAARQITAVGLEVERANETNDAPADTVFDQDPEFGSRADKKSSVTFRVSTGPILKAVPAVVGQDVDDAQDRCSRRPASRSPSSTARTTRSRRTRFSSRSRRPTHKRREGSTVTLTVSSGRAKVAVPNVVGQEENDAFAAISRAGLTPRRAIQNSASVPAGEGHQHQPGRRVPGRQGIQRDRGGAQPVEDPSTTTAPATTTTLGGGGFFP